MQDKPDTLLEDKSKSFEIRRSTMLKEMDLIQEIIKRMATTSFLIKGWAITLIAFIFSYKSDPNATHFILIPVILFWFLDSYFLQHERLYRKLYAWVVQNRMTDDTELFSLNTLRFKPPGETIFSTMFSLTLFTFYGGAVLLLLVYLLSRTCFLSWLLTCVCK